MKKVLFTSVLDSFMMLFNLPLLKYFKEQGYEVHVATSGDDSIPYCDKKFKISLERNPFKVNNLKAIKQLKKIIDSEHYDIIHTHTPMGSAVTRLAAKEARKNGTRVIYTAHGFHFFTGAPLVNWLVYYPVEKYLSKYTDTLITINMEDYERAKAKFKKCKDIQYVPGVGIDEDKFNFEMTPEEKHELRSSLGIKDEDFVMIFPAELNKNKNQIMLINAMEELVKEHKDIHLLLPGKDSLDGYYQQVTKEKGLENNIHFLRFRKDIPKLLKISNLSVASSQREGLPVNLLEAMYVGLPIIATNCRGQRDLVKDGYNGYIVEINDVDTLVDKIRIIYEDKKIRNVLVNNSNTMVKNYLLNKVMIKMKGIYSNGNEIK